MPASLYFRQNTRRSHLSKPLAFPRLRFTPALLIITSFHQSLCETAHEWTAGSLAEGGERWGAGVGYAVAKMSAARCWLFP